MGIGDNILPDPRAQCRDRQYRLRLQGRPDRVARHGWPGRRTGPCGHREKDRSACDARRLGRRLPRDRLRRRSRSTHLPICAASRSTCPRARSRFLSSRISARRRARSTSPNFIQRCRPKCLTARKTRWPTSKPRKLPGAEILFADGPYVGRLLDPGERRVLEQHAGRASTSGRRRNHRQTHAQRAASAALNNSLRATLEGQGIIFNAPDKEPFRQALISSGFYKEWSGKFDPALWSALEQFTGPLGASAT